MALNARHLITVTPGGILYRDRADVVRWIDFKACNLSWLRTRATLSPEDERIVGWRNTGDVAWLDVEFFTEPHTRFVFRSYADRDSLLLNPMWTHGGWLTRDLG